MTNSEPSNDEWSSDLWERAAQNLVRKLEEPSGSIEVYFPTAHLCVTRARGHLSVPIARMLPEAYEAHGPQSQLIASFHDWQGLKTYETEARRLLTVWTLATSRNLRAIEILAGSRVVAMGIGAASLATKAIRLPMLSYTNRFDFERSLARALP